MTGEREGVGRGRGPLQQRLLHIKPPGAWDASNTLKKQKQQRNCEEEKTGSVYWFIHTMALFAAGGGMGGAKPVGTIAYKIDRVRDLVLTVDYRESALFAQLAPYYKIIFGPTEWERRLRLSTTTLAQGDMHWSRLGRDDERFGFVVERKRVDDLDASIRPDPKTGVSRHRQQVGSLLRSGIPAHLVMYIIEDAPERGITLIGHREHSIGPKSLFGSIIKLQLRDKFNVVRTCSLRGTAAEIAILHLGLEEYDEEKAQRSGLYYAAAMSGAGRKADMTPGKAVEIMLASTVRGVSDRIAADIAAHYPSVDALTSAYASIAPPTRPRMLDHIPSVNRAVSEGVCAIFSSGATAPAPSVATNRRSPSAAGPAKAHSAKPKAAARRKTANFTLPAKARVAPLATTIPVSDDDDDIEMSPPRGQ